MATENKVQVAAVPTVLWRRTRLVADDNSRGPFVEFSDLRPGDRFWLLESDNTKVGGGSGCFVALSLPTSAPPPDGNMSIVTESCDPATMTAVAAVELANNIDTRRSRCATPGLCDSCGSGCGNRAQLRGVVQMLSAAELRPRDIHGRWVKAVAKASITDEELAAALRPVFNTMMAVPSSTESKLEELWVCQACGKSGPAQDKVGDESCWLKAVRVIPSSVVRDDRGMVKSATAWGHVETLPMMLDAPYQTTTTVVATNSLVIPSDVVVWRFLDERLDNAGQLRIGELFGFRDHDDRTIEAFVAISNPRPSSEGRWVLEVDRQLPVGARPWEVSIASTTSPTASTTATPTTVTTDSLVVPPGVLVRRLGDTKKQSPALLRLGELFSFHSREEGERDKTLFFTVTSAPRPQPDGSVVLETNRQLPPGSQPWNPPTAIAFDNSTEVVCMTPGRFARNPGTPPDSGDSLDFAAMRHGDVFALFEDDGSWVGTFKVAQDPGVQGSPAIWSMLCHRLLNRRD